MQFPGSGVVLGCINSLSLPPFLLSKEPSSTHAFIRHTISETLNEILKFASDHNGSFTRVIR